VCVCWLGMALSLGNRSSVGGQPACGPTAGDDQCVLCSVLWSKTVGGFSDSQH
jgi:hypothetical protein